MRLLLFLLTLLGVGALPAAAQLLVANDGTNSIELYSSTGVLENANFITGVSGLSGPANILVSGNDVFVSNWTTGTVGEYSAVTGAVINANFVTGLTNAFGLVASSNTLFVTSDAATSYLGAYNLTTGAAINAHLVTGSYLTDVVLSGSTLYVGNNGTGKISTYTTSGGVTNASLATASAEEMVLDGGDLLVSTWESNSVAEYNATTGALVNANFLTGLNNAQGLVVSGNDVFVGNRNGSTVEEFNATTGALENANFITGLNNPVGLALDPEAQILSTPEPRAWLFAVVILGLVGVLRYGRTEAPSAL